jgi:aerobic-type carbon monoxide dehydrogenase small subunit (CoxS/CutS family)
MSTAQPTITDTETITIRLTINGVERELAVDPAETLLTTLRQRLGLMSVRGTCYIGVCGVCTVLVDGRAISGCLALTALQEGAAITTAEGLLDAEGRPNPVQAAFIEHSAFQCSYCTPAMVLATTALLSERSYPSEDEIREYLAGNLCRCGSYPQVIEAIRSLAPAVPDSAQPEPNKQSGRNR